MDDDNLREEPIDHPSLAKYPNSATALVRIDGGPLQRVPVQRDRDEAVAVPVHDLMEARMVIHQFRKLIDSGAGDDTWIRATSWGLGRPGDDMPEMSREDLSVYLRGLWERVSAWLPYW
jgi:hypothetical protein